MQTIPPILGIEIRRVNNRTTCLRCKLLGTFTCQHYRSNTSAADTWISTDVAPYGLVKSTSADGSEMVLAKVLTNAKSKITGTPQPFDPSQMMRQRPND